MRRRAGSPPAVAAAPPVGTREPNRHFGVCNLQTDAVSGLVQTGHVCRAPPPEFSQVGTWEPMLDEKISLNEFNVIARQLQATVDEASLRQHTWMQKSLSAFFEQLERSVHQLEKVHHKSIAQAQCSDNDESKAKTNACMDLQAKVLMQSDTKLLEGHQCGADTLLLQQLLSLSEQISKDTSNREASFDELADRLVDRVATYIDRTLAQHFTEFISKRANECVVPLQPPAPTIRTFGGDDSESQSNPVQFSPNSRQPANELMPVNLRHLTPLTRSWQDLQEVLSQKTPIDELVGAVGWNKQPVVSREEARPTHLIPCLRVQSFLQSGKFNFGLTVIILINAFLIAFQTDFEVKLMIKTYHSRINNQLGLEFGTPNWINGLDMAFTIAFSIELLIRMAAAEIRFFTGEAWKWNVFDMVLVVSAVLDHLLAGFENLSFIRLLRVLRAARAIRVLRVVRWLRELRVMIISLMMCVSSLFWAMVFLFSMQFLFAVIFLQGVVNYLDVADPDAAEMTAKGENIPNLLTAHFGSLGDALLSLFACVLGGVDWIEVYEPLNTMGFAYGLLFLGYLWFMLIGVLNVVVGMFVENANNSSRKERSMLAQEELQNAGSYFQDLKATLLSVGANEHGQMSEAGLAECLSQPDVSRCFEAHAIDSSEAVSVLRLLGSKGLDGEQKIDVDEFIIALLLLKGERGKEMVPYWYETKQLSNKVVNFMRFANDHFMHQEVMLMRQCSHNPRPTFERL